MVTVGPVIVELLLFDVQDTGLPSLAPLGLLGLWLVLKGLHEVLAVEVVLRLPCVIPIIISHTLQQVLHLAVPADALVNVSTVYSFSSSSSVGRPGKQFNRFFDRLNHGLTHP